MIYLIIVADGCAANTEFLCEGMNGIEKLIEWWKFVNCLYANSMKKL